MSNLDAIKKLYELIKTHNKPEDYGKRTLIDVSAVVETKGSQLKLKYISWSHCEKMGNILDPAFDWNVEFGEKMVKITMTINNKTRSHFYPYLDNVNKPIANPTNWDYNNAQMRGFAKLFSMMTGIGINIYTGEDIQQYE